MNQSFLTKWSWRGFFIRYSLILIGLVAIYYFITPSSVSNPNQTSQDDKSPTMKVAHELVGRDLHLSFELSNFDLSLENVNKDKQENQGHIHLYVDGTKVMKIYEKEYIFKNLETGKHEIKVELAHNDHESYGIEQTFEVEIKD